MASKFFRPHYYGFQKRALLMHHKKLIEQYYDFLKCTIKDKVLVCIGKIHNVDYKNDYQLEIKCIAGKEPYSKIVEPSGIIPDTKIHMYNDHSVCLHYPPDMKWNGLIPIYKYTIPWLVEWIHFYELYLINGGKWEGRESPVHFTEEDKNIAEEKD